VPSAASMANSTLRVRCEATRCRTRKTHSLVVAADVPEMITLFQVNGAMIYVDPDGAVLGYEDAFTKIELCRKHYTAVGLGENFVDQFIR